MVRGRWGQGPTHIGGAGEGIRLPQIPNLSARRLKAIVGAVGLLILLILLVTGYYQIEPHAVGVVQRFGQCVRTTEPGPHLKIPLGIERVTTVTVQRQLKEEFGFETVSAGVRSQFQTSPERAQESLMKTASKRFASPSALFTRSRAYPSADRTACSASPFALGTALL